MQSSRDNIRVKCDNRPHRFRGSEEARNRSLGYRRPVRTKKLEFVAARSRAVVPWKLSVMMTRRHTALSVRRIAVCEGA
jgi:hypothetical protein